MATAIFLRATREFKVVRSKAVFFKFRKVMGSLNKMVHFLR